MLALSRVSSISNGSGRSTRPLIGRCLALLAAVLPISLGIAACAGNPPPVPVFASRADWEILSGHWSGSYKTSPSGRRGIIEFTLSADTEQALGDILMIADGARVPYRPYPPNDPRQGPINAPYTQLLTIRFVRTDSGQISGTIASYWDPDRSCQAAATFVGEVQNRAIEGTFTSACEDGVRQLRGTWRVTRQSVNSR
jgi:hypothetical protein